MNPTVWLDGEDVVLRLYIQPKASRDKILGLHGDELKIAITAPPRRWESKWAFNQVTG